jgi:hypothetical protein
LRNIDIANEIQIGNKVLTENLSVTFGAVLFLLADLPDIAKIGKKYG